jgi:outer membrane protein assembly factor BamE (lipoprotein component of BamABCDE complex)
MKTIKMICLLGALLAGLCSCGTLASGGSNNKMMRVQEGMTHSQVEAIMGKPTYRRFNESREEWEYNTARFNSYDRDVFVVIFDREGHVIAMNAYLHQAPTVTKVPAGTTQVVTAAPPVIATVPPVITATPPIVATVPPPAHNCTPLTDARFKVWFERYKRIPFDDDRLADLKLTVRDKCFTCRQCVQVLHTVAFTDEKKQILRIMAPYICDVDNYELLVKEIGVFERKEIHEILMNRRLP